MSRTELASSINLDLAGTIRPHIQIMYCNVDRPVDSKWITLELRTWLDTANFVQLSFQSLNPGSTRDDNLCDPIDTLPSKQWMVDLFVQQPKRRVKSF